MAEDAFALSPISARASLPTEADYEAIASAFMETARGRWFLGEYAKRNRNADTRLVLDAVERIETTLAQQKATSEPALADVVPALAEAIEEARRKVLAALPTNEVEVGIEAILKAASVLRDMAWGLRESGADSRLCDLIEVEAKTIIDGCSGIYADQAGSAETAAEAMGALDSLAAQIASLGQPGDTFSRAPKADAGPPGVELDDPPAQAEVAPASAAREATFEIVDTGETFQAPHPEPQVFDTLTQIIQSETVTAPAARSASLWDDLEIIDTGPDEALPQVVAAAPEPTAAGPKIQEPQVLAQPPAPEPRTAPPIEDAAAMAVPAEPSPAVPDVAKPQQPPAPSSLGQAALEGGLVLATTSRRADPLAPIQRMSQAEKIAFFS
jgi:hypothetical protein